MAYFLKGTNPQARQEETVLAATGGGGGGGGGLTPHALISGYHLASGLTTGHILKATGTASFAFQAHGLTYSDVGADASGSAAAVQYNLTTHIGLTGTAVHGLGSASTRDESYFAPSVHALVGANHSASGLTAGHFLRALTDTTFGFQAMEAQAVHAVQFHTTPTVAAALGLTYWDEHDNTLATTLDDTPSNTVTLQHGQELHCRVLNNSGATIPNGSLVYQSGTSGNRPTIALADASDIAKCRIIGMTTQDIANNAMGYVTHYGIVRDVNTNGLPDPSLLWLSATTPGAWTTSPPSSPNFTVLVGCTLNSTTNGSIYMKPQTTLAADTTLLSPGDHTIPPTQLAVLTAITNAIAPWWTLAAETHFTSGILSRTDNSLGLSTRTVTINPTATDFDIYLDAVKFVKTGGASCSTEFGTDLGMHFIYFDATGTLQNSTTPWVIKDGLAPVAIAWWNGSAARLLDERHSAARNCIIHDYLHSTVGTRYEEGLDQTYPTTANDGIIQIEVGTIWDEDIAFAIAQAVRCVLWYQTSGAAWTWANGTNNGGYDRPYIWNAGTSRLQYPKSDSSYTLTDAGNSEYLCVWVYAVNDGTPGDVRPIWIVTAARTGAHNTIAQARAETEPVGLRAALSPEIKLIYRWIYRGDGEFQEAADYRSVSNLPSGVSATQIHNSLLLLQGGAPGEYYHLTAAQQAVVAAYTTVGAALLALTNPGAIRFLRINADNTVTALSDADYKTAIGAVSTTGDETIAGNKTFSGNVRAAAYSVGMSAVSSAGCAVNYSTNGVYGFAAYNPNSGASARVMYQLNNNVCNSYIYLNGNGVSVSGYYAPNGLLIMNTGAGGINIATTVDADVRVFRNGSQIFGVTDNGIVMQSGKRFQGDHSSSDGTAGMDGTITFYAASSSGGTVNVLNTVTIKDGLITAWSQA